nr:hypothetical protein HK105_005533 [Polyrhizophydium stewartii]
MMSATSWQADTRFNQQVSPTIEAKIVFQRYWPSRFFSIFVFCIQWILSVIALILSTTLWFRNRKVEPPTIGVIASLLFALPAIRSAQPGAPPVGCTLDVAGYFWNLGLAALSMMLLMINYIVRYTREKRRATLSSMRAARAARARAETVAGDVSDMESGAEESDFDGSLSGVSDVETLDSPVEKGPPAQLEKVEVHVPDVSSLPPALRRSARRNSQAVLERRTEQHVRFA